MAELTIVENPSDVDWADLHRLLHRAFAYMDRRIDPPSSLHRLTLAGLQEKAAQEILYLVYDANRLVGCMFCRPQAQWIYVGKVAVEPSHQGRGIGRILFEKAFELAAERKSAGLELETRVELIENHQAFARLGFVKVGEDAHEGYDRPTSIRMRAPVKANEVLSR